MSTVSQEGLRSVAPGAGETLWVLGDRVTLLADGERDNLTMFVATIPPGGGPPPHVHHKQEEAHYIIEGTFSFLNGSEWIQAHAGTFVLIPRGVVHTFRNTGDRDGRLVSTDNLPGSHERWFRHVGVPIRDSASFRPPDTPPDMEDVLRSAAQEDIVMLLPAGSRQQE